LAIVGAIRAVQDERAIRVLGGLLLGRVTAAADEERGSGRKRDGQ
jgi:hypothetical protein